MKSFSTFLIEENKQTIIHKLGWQDADNWWGTTMNYKKKISIANEHGKKIGDGSARTVFEIDYARHTVVMKIAKSEKGLRQNLAEVNLYKKYRKKPPYMAPMIDFDDNREADVSFLVVHKAARFDPNLFWREFGITFEDFQKESSRIINKQERKHPDNKVLNKFLKFIEKNKIMLGELRRKDEWGAYNGKSVILDAGINKDNYEIAF